MPHARLTPLERARRYVARMPRAIEGSGGDAQTLAVANTVAWDFALSPGDAMTIMAEYNSRCVPPWTEADLLRKLQSAERQPHTKPRGSLVAGHPLPARAGWRPPPRPTPRPQIDATGTVETWLRGFRALEADLGEASPIRPPEDWTHAAHLLVEHLYQPGDNVNFVVDYQPKQTDDGREKARPVGHGRTLERDALLAHWRANGLPRSAAGGWVRMNPVTGGIADEHVTTFRYALLECDTLPLDLQLSLFARLPLPVAALVGSGARSVHAWIKVDAVSAAAYRKTVTKLLRLLGRFGVDRQNQNPSRLSRLPGVVRTIGVVGDGRQRLLYLNPHPTQNAIL